MPAMQPGPHARGDDLAAVALQVRTVTSGHVMIRLLFPTRDQWAWQCRRAPPKC